MKKIAYAVLIIFLLVTAVGCRRTDVRPTETVSEEEEKTIRIGFSQLGAESDWRNANTESMIRTFTKEKGYELIIDNAQQKQTNQIMAIRTFIQQEVDYIVLAPVTETGWDTVLQEAKEAGIPVIIVDRKVDVEDESLFVCWVGSNFELEGKKAVEWLRCFTEKKGIDPSDIHIADIQGTLGASAQIGRTRALEEAAKLNGWDLLDLQPGDFTQAKGREVMEAFLEKYDDLNVIYCENDNEALGALEAIEAAGKKAGSDIGNGEIMVLSFDGVNQEALSYVIPDRISCIAECNPLHGPRVEALIVLLEAGEMPEKYSYVDGAIFCADKTVDKITVVGMEYGITVPTIH